jgi:hypothetical protein
MLENGLEAATLGDLERVLTKAHDIAQDTEKQDADAHLIA